MGVGRSSLTTPSAGVFLADVIPANGNTATAVLNSAAFRGGSSRIFLPPFPERNARDSEDDDVAAATSRAARRGSLDQLV